MDEDIKEIRRRAGIVEVPDGYIGEGFLTNIEKETVKNTDYRRVLFTTNQNQLVVMSIEPGDEIGEETHKDISQFIRFEAGRGIVIIDGEKKAVGDGDSVIVPAGSSHNVVNTSPTESLKLYTIYSPPEHKPGTVEKTKQEATKIHEQQTYDVATQDQVDSLLDEELAQMTTILRALRTIRGQLSGNTFNPRRTARDLSQLMAAIARRYQEVDQARQRTRR